jgi:hypothetical protein
MRYGQRLDRLLTRLLPDFLPVEQDVTISAEQLQANGYFKHFAHHLCGVGSIPPSQYHNCVAEGAYDGPFDPSGSFLTPAACLNLYPTLFALGQDAPQLQITSLAKVFRNETNYSRYRGREFVVREFVFYGPQSTVEQQVESVLQTIQSSLVIRQGSLTVGTATDSFVPLPLGKLMKSNQLKARVKRELILDAVPVAIGSANLHGNHFMKAHGIQREGFVTACIGVGLSRIDAAGDDGVIDLND